MSEQLRQTPDAILESTIEPLLPEDPITDELTNTGFLEGDISGEIQNKTKKRIVVSNRLPINLVQIPDGKFLLEQTYGGLVTAMSPILNGDGYEGVWIGWPGSAANKSQENEAGGLEEALLSHADRTGLNMKAVTLSPEQQEVHYERVSNEIFWALFHATPENGLIENVTFENQQYYFPHPDRPSYQDTQVEFAKPIIEELKDCPDSQILLQDYHLLNEAKILKQAGVTQPIGFFLHIPYPPVEILQDSRIDQTMVTDIVHSLTFNDLIGFHTEKDVNNFLASVEQFLPQAIIDREQKTIEIDGRITHYGDFLISIDVEEYKKKASESKVLDIARSIKADFPDREVMLAGGRLDYTKGFDYLLQALDITFTKHPDLKEKLNLILYTPKSRGNIEEYRTLAERIDTLVLKVNQTHGTGELEEQAFYSMTNGKEEQLLPTKWKPIIHLPWGLQGADQLGMIKAKTIGAYPSVMDGANLMVQEDAVASNKNTVLILGEGAGSLQRMKNGVIPVNPLDIEGFAESIYASVMKTPKERQEMMEIAQESVESYTIFEWAHDYTHALEAVTK